MKRIAILSLLVTFIALFTSCTENYSNGERIGTLTQFSKKGLIWKSHEGHLNVTQTGMNSSTGFDFSVDNDNEPTDLIAQLDSAANLGWKIKLNYHETAGYNWFGNRGATDHFITTLTILDRNFDNPFAKFNNNSPNSAGANQAISGRTIDTIYVVIYRDLKNMPENLPTKTK